MLNKAERFQMLKIFRVCSIVGLLPIHIDLASWQLMEPSKRKKWICAASYIIFNIHGLYKMGTLAFTLGFVPNIPLHQLMIHAIIAMTTGVLMIWYYWVYINCPTLFTSFLHITLLGNTGGVLGERDELRRDWTTRLREYSMQDLIATSIPFMVVVTALVATCSYVYDPSMRLLLYAALPTGLQTWPVFTLCLLEEFRFLSILGAILVPLLQLQVIAFDLVAKQLELSDQAIPNGRQRVIRNVHALLCRLQLYVSMLNNINSFLVFTFKLLCISAGILSGYAAIAHFSEFPLFGVLYYILLFDVTLLYTLIYDKAFKIPQLFGQVSADALLHIGGKQKQVLRMQILSIPRTGIKVGNFHTMERESTMIFMDFVVKNIVNMLVAYG